MFYAAGRPWRALQLLWNLGIRWIALVRGGWVGFGVDEVPLDWMRDRELCDARASWQAVVLEYLDTDHGPCFIDKRSVGFARTL